MMSEWIVEPTKVRKTSIVICGIWLIGTLAMAQTAPPDQDQFQPMTQEERLHHFIKGTFSVESLVRSAAGAGILQWTNTPSEWQQGAEGYARRFGNSYAQHIMRQTIMYGASSLLDEDNRYLPSGRSGAGARLKYAVGSTFLARKHDGTRRISLSRLGSYAAVAFISREWQPRSTSGAQNAATSFETTLGSEVGFNIAREFLPGIFHSH
jgi:hypothetical protein